MMRPTLVAIVLLCISLPALAQTCPAAPADPIPRDAAKLAWNAVTTWAQGGAIPTTAPVTYSVYEVVASAPVKRCETTALSAGQTGLTVGVHTWFVTAKHPSGVPPNTEGAPSTQASKTIPAAPLTPSAPTSFTITGTITITPQ